MTNKILKDAVNFDPTKKSQTATVVSLNEDIKNNKISLPIYQRHISWQLQKSVDLFNYQLFGKAPVSPLSFNKIKPESSNSMQQVKLLTRELIPMENISSDQVSVVDGQQRLSTNYRAYIDDSTFQNIVLDLKKGKFRLLEEGPMNHQIPVGKLLNQDDSVMSSYVSDKMNITDFNDMQLLLQIRTKLRQYSYTLHIAEDMTELQQIEWFEVLNNAGSKVTALQMTFAKLASQEFDIYSEYGIKFQELVETFDTQVKFSPYTTNVSYPVAALNPELELYLKQEHKANYAPMPSDTKENTLAKVDKKHPGAIKEIALKTLDDVAKALDFLKVHGLNDSVDRMDYILNITGYFAYHSNLTEEQEEYLVNWVKKVNFRNKTNKDRRDIYSNLLKSKQI